MRDRLLTPFFPLPWGELSAELGAESPVPQQIPARDLVGKIVGNGRYVLRQKTGHSQESVRFEAHDMMAGIEVQLELYPDGQEAQGFRLGGSDALKSARDLPNLYNEERTRESSQPVILPESWWKRSWGYLMRLFR